MRSVKVERKQRGSRATPARGAARGTRPADLRASYERRGKPRPGLLARTRDGLRDWLVRRRPMFALGLAFVMAALVTALFAGGYVGRAIRSMDRGVDAAIAGAGFGISEVHLAGNVRVPPQTVLAALGFQPGESIFGADLQEARARLMRLDWVADADVQRRYPDAISVRLVEKLPFALWKSPGGIYVVERNGGLITSRGVDAFARLPLLAGAGAPKSAAEIVDAVAQHRALAARVKIYQRQSERRWNLILDDGVLVELPETGWQKELDTLETLIVDKGILERNVTEIDLRSPSHYFFMLKGEPARHSDRENEL
jgi:cell division protein FtsQ